MLVYKLCLLVVFGISVVASQGATLIWDKNPESDLAGYNVYARDGLTGAVSKTNVGLNERYTISGFEAGKTIYFNVTAYNLAGLESDFSDTLAYTIPLNLMVKWSKSPVAGVVGYRLRFGQLNQLAQSVDCGLNLTHALNVTRGLTYFLYLEATNLAGQVVDTYAQNVYAIPATGSLATINLARVNIAPVSALAHPLEGAEVTIGIPAKISAVASDPDGSIVRVDFFAGSTKIGTATAAPYEIMWTPASAGQIQFSVIAVDNQSASARSPYRMVTVKDAVPFAPASLAATATSSTSARLSWTDQANNEQGFYIYRAVAGGSFSRVATTAANANTFNDPGLSPGISYQYRVSSFNTSGESAVANVNVTTLPVVPAKPVILAAIPSTASVVLKWTDASTNESGFRVYRALAGGSFTLIATLAAGATSITNTGLVALTAYEYRVTSFNSGGESTFAHVSVSTLPTLPAAPTEFMAVAQWTPSIRLTWKDNANNESGYYLYRSVNGGQYSLVAMLPANTLSFTNNALLSGTRYDFKLSAYNSAGESASGVATATTFGSF